jgi:hypothetical protein
LWNASPLGLRFQLKPLRGYWISRKLGRKEFQGSKAAQFNVSRFINHSHSSGAKMFNNKVVRNGLANHAGGPTANDVMRGALLSQFAHSYCVVSAVHEASAVHADLGSKDKHP